MDSKSSNVGSRTAGDLSSAPLCSASTTTNTTRPSSAGSENIRQACTLRNSNTHKEMWTVEICPTIGNTFQLRVHGKETIEGLKKTISRNLKIPREKITLLHRENILQEGRLLENGVCDGSRLQLLPNVESGLTAQKTENTVLQALENLSEGQVQEFLSGKSPLTLAMRLGDHMMFVQLQLSTNGPNFRKPASSHHHHHQHQSRSRSSNYAKNCSPSEAAVTPAAIPAVLPPAAGRGEPRHPLEACSPPTSPSISGLSSPNNSSSSSETSDSEVLPTLDNRALVQAKRNLSQKLKEISQLQDQTQEQKEEADTASKNPGAIIESMQHLGQGVYSGTFSGALNPALQDQDGKPKRSISTIIHILNDLLGASPQYRAHLHARRTNRMGSHRQHAPVFGDLSQSQENQATRGKMEELQQRLEERRQRRQARRQARSCPYATTTASSTAAANCESDQHHTIAT